MPRPRNPRFLQFNPNVYYFKPQGIPLRLLDEVALLPDEIEAIKLHDVDKLDQKQSAEQMQISQPTLARLLDSAYKKIAEALVNGKAIRIEKVLTSGEVATP
jgi:uncharacterized protein